MIDRFRRATDLAKFKADQLVRVNRVQSELNSYQHEIILLKTKIANRVVELHKTSQLADSELDGLCSAINGLDAQIEQKQTLMASIRAESLPASTSAAVGLVSACPNCSYDVPSGSVFCPNCGAAVGPATGQVDPDIPKCPKCGFAVPADAQFCTNCGQALATL